VKALVIDDHRAVRMFVERVLHDAGYETMTASDGVHAVQVVLKEGPPDLVVTDESMPRMSGHEFARWVQRGFSGVKVLFLTGYVEHAEGASGDLWENVAYLEKPCSVRGLQQAASRLMFRRFAAPVTSRPSPAL